MLNPNNDRLFYGNILTPPANYELDFAIGSTYSLDLDALVGASISLGLSDDIDSNLSDNSIYLLDALRTTSKNVVLFCENGQIKLPSNVTPLYILLENIVFQVKTLKNFRENRYASFHPKFWLLKYKNDDNFIFRLVVLSRNLTFDRSWDISFAMDGEKSDSVNKKNRPIIEFLKYLLPFCSDSDKSQKIDDIIDELMHVKFSLHSNIFNDFEFYVNGIGGKSSINNDVLFSDEELNELMVISPFLSSDIIANFNSRKLMHSKALLFTRLNSLVALNFEDCSNFDVYVLKDEIIDGESIVSEEAFEISKQDIHAKIYVTEDEKSTNLYIGSLNASHNALNGNVEFMIKLHADKNKLNIGMLADDLFNGEKGGPKDPFKLIEMDKIELIEEDNDSNNLDLKLKYLSRLNSKANVVLNNDFYDINVVFENLDESQLDGIEVTIKPLLSNKKQILSNFIIFEKLDKLDLSEFFIITLKDDMENVLEKVIKIQSEGMPEDRHNEVISSIITDETAFIKYVAFLLGDEYVLNIAENNSFTKVNGGVNIQLPELYEKMLRATVYSPEKFKELEFLIRSITKDNVIPEGFVELYNTFVKVIENDRI